MLRSLGVALLLSTLLHAEEAYWERLVVCGGFEHMGAIDAATGEWAWKRHGSGVAWAGRRADGAVAYVAPEEGGIECVDLRTGATKWRCDGYAHGGPVGEACWIGCQGSEVVRLSLPDGAVTWKVTLGSEVSTVRPPAMAADSVGVYACTNAGLAALDSATGKALWKREGHGYERLRLVNGGIYACAKYGGTPAYIRRIDRATGKDLWRYEVQTELEPAPVMDLADEKVVLASSTLWGNEGWTVALEAATGKPKWTLHSPTTAAWCDLGRGRLWLYAPQAVVVVDLETGKELWREKLAGDAAVFLLEENRLLVAAYGQIDCTVSMAACDPAKLSKLWQADVKGIQVPHSEYYQRVRIERLGPRLMLVGEAVGGTFVEVVDPATGKVTSRFSQK